jgi:hypothetical protein
MIVDIDEAMEAPENVEDTNPRAVVVIPKLTKRVTKPRRSRDRRGDRRLRGRV